jgi:hypothetical protein
MSKLGFSKAESAYVARVVRSGDSNFDRLGFYAATLLPSCGFGFYGIVRGEIIALALAFIGLLLFLIWRISAELRHARVYFALFAKIDAFERTDNPDTAEQR